MHRLTYSLVNVQSHIPKITAHSSLRLRCNWKVRQCFQLSRANVGCGTRGGRCVELSLPEAMRMSDLHVKGELRYLFGAQKIAGTERSGALAADET